MKFGPVPLQDAEGAILAHSIDAAAEGQIRDKIAKGTRLTPDHLDRLRATGLSEVTVARLGPDDVHEDTAAAQLARALVDPDCGLQIGVAATGRVNARAPGPGIVALDPARIMALNTVNPGITVATVAPWHRLEARGLAATIKIIPYAVPQADLDLACARARAALSFRMPEIRAATLIETQVGARALSDKGRAAMTERLARMGVHLSERVVVGHDITEIAQALEQAPGPLRLILTGSATSDSHDIAPQALRHAGGSVHHYGMPVDPGNLLFIGDLGGNPVIGLPGCARSPALNGADWVLERVICGVPVGPDEIAAMGVGGLLKEIPSRPLPRQRIDNTD